MHIAILTNYHLEKVGGAEEAIDRLAAGWQHSGQRVTLFASPPRAGWKGSPRPWQPAYPVVRIPRPRSTTFGLRQYVRDLGRIHAAQPFDILFACDAYWPGHVARLFARKSGVPYVLNSQGSDIMEGSRFLKGPLKRRRIVRTLADADGIACISSYMRSRVETLAKPRGRIALIPNGWPDEWAVQAPAARIVPAPYLLGIGRLIALKGFQTAIAAYVQSACRNYGLVIAGDGDYRPQLEAQALESGLPVISHVEPPPGQPPWIWLPGFVHGEHKRSIVQHAALGVVPSIRQEPLGIVVLEMLCSGVPVLGSRVGGIPDIIQPGVNGDLFEANDVRGLSACLQSLLLQPDRLTRLAAGTRESVAPFRWNLIAETYVRFFGQIVASRR
jgi:glycosyltransferase involved in cell wall biosynthesis